MKEAPLRYPERRFVGRGEYNPKQFKKCPHVKKQLWGGEFWSDGYFASTVGKHGNEQVISAYVKNQGHKYTKLHGDDQLRLL